MMLRKLNTNAKPISKQCIFLAIIIAVTLSCTRKETTSQDFVSALPSMYITLPPEQYELIIDNTEYKAPAQVLLVTADNDTLYDGECTHIKTRGNSTFKDWKKPFTIKFPQKQSLFGLDKSRSFVLLANALDESHIRNAIALDLAHALGLPAPQYTYISLYINGRYRGLYQMTNKVEVGKHTLNITDLDKLNKQANSHPLDDYTWFGLGKNKQIIQQKGVLLEHNPDDITGGYLLDNSGVDWIYCKSTSGFVSDAGDPIQIRSPKYASQKELDYIKTLYNELELAAISEDGTNPQTGKHYSEYIDVASFARYYLLNELLLNQDGGFASFLMYKDSDAIDSKIYAGPVWDFDKSLCSPSCFLEMIAHNEIYVSARFGDCIEPHSGGLLYYLWRHDDFQQIAKELYYQEISPSCHEYLEKGIIDSLVTVLSPDANRDNQIYRRLKDGDYSFATKKVVDFLQNRLEFLDWFFSTSQDELIEVGFQSKNKGHYDRGIKMYLPVGEPIQTPTSLIPYSVIYNNDPILEFYIAGTDSIVPDGTVFHSSKKLELRYRQPTKKEVQMRRIKKKLESIDIF